MLEYEVAPLTRLCSVTNRELQAGEAFFAALIDENGKFVRKDFAADAWNGAPPGAIAYWTGKVPTSERSRKPTFNDELLMEWFQHLAGNPEPSRMNFRYVIALLLMRRKRLKFEDVKKTNGPELLIVRDARNGTRYELPDPRLSEEEITTVQEEVFQALGWQ
jgi:hypothetical protein